MIAGSIARRYAKALLEIGQAAKTSDALGKELERVTVLLGQSRELADALSNPVFKLSQRQAIVEDLVRRLSLQPVMRSFLRLLLDRGRMAALPDITREHRALVDQAAGRVRAVLTTAKPIDQMQELRIKAALERRTGKIVILEKREDPELIGGVVTQIGDVVYDGSVRSQLQALRHQLLN